MPWHNVSERLQHRVLHAGMLRLEIEQQAFQVLTLQAPVSADRTAAANDWKLLFPGICTSLVLIHINERTDDNMTPVIR